MQLFKTLTLQQLNRIIHFYACRNIRCSLEIFWIFFFCNFRAYLSLHLKKFTLMRIVAQLYANIVKLSDISLLYCLKIFLYHYIFIRKINHYPFHIQLLNISFYIPILFCPDFNPIDIKVPCNFAYFLFRTAGTCSKRKDLEIISCLLIHLCDISICIIA